jgi:hypothetical protein
MVVFHHDGKFVIHEEYDESKKSTTVPKVVEVGHEQ